VFKQIFLTVIIGLFSIAGLSAQTKLLRFPDVQGDKVVFTYGGDLWTASTNGGNATGLTVHPGMEVFAKFSPDGKWIAFTGQYDGDEQVYVIPSTGGGNVSRMIIERLSRKYLGVNFARTDDKPTTYPDGVFIGPMVSILNENSSSDGDIFPYMFREAGLGTLIGKRSWGGVIGIQNRGSLVDGGNVFVPGSALASTKGEYVIEGYGVDPDIEVENDPKSVIAGRNPQLERAVDEVLKKLTKLVKLPNRPKDPVKLND
jgi:tricorn protease